MRDTKADITEVRCESFDQGGRGRNKSPALAHFGSYSVDQAEPSSLDARVVGNCVLRTLKFQIGDKVIWWQAKMIRSWVSGICSLQRCHDEITFPSCSNQFGLHDPQVV